MAKSNRRSASSPSPSPQRFPSRRWIESFRRNLRAWFDRERRDLPWRRSRDPYRVWISEIMLQQTQVAAVVGYFQRFIAAFPDVAALAAAPEHDVLRLWEGLGYYRRARQLHRAAQTIVGEHGGVFPDDAEAVRRLPGVGRYTTGAILSIAFDRPEPILEANTVRLLSRLAAYRDDPLARSGQQLLWSWAEALVPEREPGLFNQGLMELGALVCTPRNPRCDACPVARLCPTRKFGLQAEIPRAKQKQLFESIREAAVFVARGDKLLVVQQAAGKRWGGLWDFPRYRVETEQRRNVTAELQAKLQATLGIKANLGEVRTTLKHGVTRFRITLEAFDAVYTGGRVKPHDFAAARWIRPTELHDYPLNVTARKLAKLLVAGETRS